MKRWPLNKAYFWETIPFFRLLLPLAAGIALYPGSIQSNEHFIGWVFAAVVACFTLYIFTAVAKQKSELSKAICFISLHLCLFFTSWVLCYYNDVRNNPQWFGNTTETAEAYVVRLTKPSSEKERSWKLEVEVINSVIHDSVLPATGKAFVYVYKYNAPALKEGDVIVIPNQWQRIKNSGNPFEFDYTSYCARENIHYRQFVSGDKIVMHTYADENSLHWIRRVHHWCVQQLEWHITDRTTSGLLKAMLMNDTGMLDGELTDAYADTGIVHIIAISGGHITVFFFLVAFLLGWIRHGKYAWVKYIAAIPLIWVYVVVAGAPPSAVRAATMFSLLGIGFALQKTPNSINTLLATAYVLLCINPAWLYAIGFQLSFIAVLSIFTFYKPIYKLYSPVNKIAHLLWSAIAVSIAAEVLVAPLVVYYFHLFPVQFIVANVLAYLFMGVILILAMLLIAVSGFYPVAEIVADVTVALATWFNQLVYVLQKLNFDSFHSLTLTDAQLFLLYLSISCFAVFLIKKNKRAMFGGIAALCLFVVVGCVHQWKLLHQQVFVLYNSGKENRIELINGKKATILYSPDSISPQMEEYVLQPAHINWHINTVERSAKKYNLVSVGGKTIFILNQPVRDTTIKVDYVVLNYNAKGMDMHTIKQVFNPEQLVIGNNISKNKAATMIQEAERIGLSVHDVGGDGAFVIEGD